MDDGGRRNYIAKMSLKKSMTHSMTDKVTEEFLSSEILISKPRSFYHRKNDSQNWLVQRISAEFINPLYFKPMIFNLDRIFHKH